MAHKAFPFRSQASEWFQNHHDEIRMAAAADPNPDAHLLHTVSKIASAFEFISGDKEQQLEAMEYKPPQIIAIFATTFYNLATDARVRDGKAARVLMSAYSKHAPELTQALKNELLSSDEITLK
eukprot:998200-Pelagomonas_calceolata.AAC.1